MYFFIKQLNEMKPTGIYHEINTENSNTKRILYTCHKHC